jgi:hypothetical protein
VGTCDRGDKAVLVGQAGATAVACQNNLPGVNGSALMDVLLPYDSLPGELIPTALIP